jgi:hypothetical protein
MGRRVESRALAIPLRPGRESSPGLALDDVTLEVQPGESVLRWARTVPARHDEGA